MYNSSVQAMQWNTWRVGIFIYHLDFKSFLSNLYIWTLDIKVLAWEMFGMWCNDV